MNNIVVLAFSLGSMMLSIPNMLLKKCNLNILDNDIDGKIKSRMPRKFNKNSHTEYMYERSGLISAHLCAHVTE